MTFSNSKTGKKVDKYQTELFAHWPIKDTKMKETAE